MNTPQTRAPEVAIATIEGRDDADRALVPAPSEGAGASGPTVAKAVVYFGIALAALAMPELMAHALAQTIGGAGAGSSELDQAARQIVASTSTLLPVMSYLVGMMMGIRAALELKSAMVALEEREELEAIEAEAAVEFAAATSELEAPVAPALPAPTPVDIELPALARGTGKGARHEALKVAKSGKGRRGRRVG